MAKHKTVTRKQMSDTRWADNYKGTITVLKPRRIRWVGIGWVDEGEALSSDPRAVENDGKPLIMLG